MNLREILKDLGYNPPPDDYRGNIATWKRWWKGEDDSFHHYYIDNGVHKKRCSRAKLRMAKRGCEYWADLLWNRECFISVEEPGGKPSIFRRLTTWLKITKAEGQYQREVDAVLAENNFTSMTNQLIDRAWGSGTGAYLVYDVGGRPRIEAIDVDYIYPLRVRNGVVIDCAFAGVDDNTQISEGRYKYDTADPKVFYVMIHTELPGGGYHVRNLYFGADENQNIKGRIPTPKDIQEEQDVNYRRFAIIKPNTANNIDEHSPFGMSIYANSLDILKNIDLAADGIQWSMSVGKPRIAIKAGAMKVTDTEIGPQPYFDENEVVLYNLGEDASGSDKPLIEDITTEYRADSFEQSLQAQLQIYSQSIGLGETTFKWNNTNVDTAYQAASIDSATARSMRKHQDGLEPAIIAVVRAVLEILKLDPNVVIKVTFDDSVVVNNESERNWWTTWAMAGKIPTWYVLREFGGLGDEEAKELDLDYQGLNDDDETPGEE